jgi:hypothetical protein
LRFEKTVVKWDDERGFGFIRPGRGGQDGGWPGALLAQQFLRHKSVKAEFRAAFWLTVAVNAVLFGR